MTKTHTRALVALLGALGACKDRPASAPVKGPSVEIFTDETAHNVAIDHPIALAKFVSAPPASWLEVRADADNERFIELAPRPDDEIRLYLDHATIAIGVFPPVTPDMPADVQRRASLPLSSLVGVTSVHVMTRLPALPPLTISVGGKDVSLGDGLRGIESTGKRRAQGWPLADVLELAGASNVETVHVVGAQEITLDVTEIAKALIKPNQRGEYVVRVWDEGAKAPTREVRQVTKIVVDGS